MAPFSQFILSTPNKDTFRYENIFTTINNTMVNYAGVGGAFGTVIVLEQSTGTQLGRSPPPFPSTEAPGSVQLA